MSRDDTARPQVGLQEEATMDNREMNCRIKSTRLTWSYRTSRSNDYHRARGVVRLARREKEPEA